jgi:uracil-DNA glycosylase
MATSISLPLELSAHHAALEALHARILACRSCELAGHIPAARPVRHPWTPRQRTMLVGQAPGVKTDRLRVHFAGPGGKLLGQWLAEAGFEDADWRDRCYVTSMTRCFPGKNPRGNGDRKPSPAELALCRPFLDEELRLVRPRLILAVGTMAMEYFLGRRPLDAVVGTIESTGDAVEAARGIPVLSLPHPSPVSRWLNDPEHRKLVDRAIELLSRARQELEL